MHLLPLIIAARKQIRVTEQNLNKKKKGTENLTYSIGEEPKRGLSGFKRVTATVEIVVSFIICNKGTKEKQKISLSLYLIYLFIYELSHHNVLLHCSQIQNHQVFPAQEPTSAQYPFRILKT